MVSFSDLSFNQSTNHQTNSSNMSSTKLNRQSNKSAKRKSLRKRDPDDYIKDLKLKVRDATLTYMSDYDSPRYFSGVKYALDKLKQALGDEMNKPYSPDRFDYVYFEKHFNRLAEDYRNFNNKNQGSTYLKSLSLSLGSHSLAISASISFTNTSFRSVSCTSLH